MTPQSAFATMFEQIAGCQSAKDAFADFARSVLASINRIASQKLAESLARWEGWWWIWRLHQRTVQGLRHGWPGQRPGTRPRTRIPRVCLLESTVLQTRCRAPARWWISCMLNGGLQRPRWQGVRLAFAEGDWCHPPPRQRRQAKRGQAVRIVNVIDPSLARRLPHFPAGEKSILNIPAQWFGRARDSALKLPWPGHPVPLRTTSTF